MLLQKCRSWLIESGSIFHLAVPITVAQLVMCLAGLADIMMAGQYNLKDLTAVALGYSIWIPVNVFLIGLLSPVTALLSELRGKGKVLDISEIASHAAFIGVVMGALAFFVLLNSKFIIILLGVEPSTEEIALGYVQAIALGMPFIAINQVIRSYLQSSGKTRVDMLIQLLCLLFNVPFNYILINGLWGFPQLGGIGCGYATSFIMLLGVILSCLYIFITERNDSRRVIIQLIPTNSGLLKDIIKLGLPYGVSLFCQFMAFSMISFLLSSLGENTISGHQIAFNVSTIPFALSASLGMATMIKVSYHLGKKEINHAQYIGKVGIALTTITSLIIAMLIYLTSRYIAPLYNDDLQVILIAVVLLKYVPIYHVGTSFQVVITSVLRSYRDTFTPMWISVFSLWFIALPLGYSLSMTNWLIEPIGAKGFWIALCSALVIANLLLFKRYQKIS